MGYFDSTTHTNYLAEQAGVFNDEDGEDAPDIERPDRWVPCPECAGYAWVRDHVCAACNGSGSLND